MDKSYSLKLEHIEDEYTMRRRNTQKEKKLISIYFTCSTSMFVPLR